MALKLHRLLAVLALCAPPAVVAGEPPASKKAAVEQKTELTAEEREIIKQLELLVNLEMLEQLDMLEDLPLLGSEGEE